MSRMSAQMKRFQFGLAGPALATLLFCPVVAPMASAKVPSPTLEGPITGPGNPFVASTTFDLARVAYKQEEYFVVNAAFAALDRWVRRGKPPKPAPRLEVAAGPPVAIVRDANGNAVGGIRTPQVDVPIAAFTGEQEGSILCRLFGTTTPFDDATLAALYPSHGAFVAAYDKATKRAVKAGFLLKPDARLMREWAARSRIGQ